MCASAASQVCPIASPAGAFKPWMRPVEIRSVGCMRKKPCTHDLGRGFEDLVASHLSARGWRILDRNVRFGRREIDLVIRRGGDGEEVKGG